MTNDWITKNGYVFPNESCCHCGDGKATIWYSIDLRHTIAEVRKLEPKHPFIGYMPFCTMCCQNLAEGMLRDVAEVMHGREKADLIYRHYQRKKQMSELGSVVSATEQITKENEAIIKILDELEKRKMYHKQFMSILDSTLKPRCVTDEELRQRVADNIGCTRAELESRVDISVITIKGTGTQLVCVSKPK